MSEYLKITKDTRTFAQSGDDYILTNEQNLTFENLDILRHRGCTANTWQKTLSPLLPIGVLTKMTPDWDAPDRQLTPEELKDYKQLK